MKIEVGRTYKKRNGQKVTCNKITDDMAFFGPGTIPVWSNGMSNGRSKSAEDVISECVRSPIIEVSKFDIVDGLYGVLKVIKTSGGVSLYIESDELDKNSVSNLIETLKDLERAL